MSKPTSLHVDYLNLEINNETIRNYNKCERSTQSNPVEHSDIATDTPRVSTTPPRRPPPLQLKPVSSFEHEGSSITSSPKIAKGGTLKSKFKGIKKSTAKKSKEVYATMTKVLANGFLKRKVKKTSMNSPLLKDNIAPSKELNVRHNVVISRGNTLRSVHSPKDTGSSLKSDSFIQPETVTDLSKGINCVSVQEQAFQGSILSSFPIMSMIDEYMKEGSDDLDDDSTEELFGHWISEFVDTCQRQIKNIILTSNSKLAHHIDLSNMMPLTGQENTVKISSIPTWTQVRILEDSSNQKYIALEKSHSLSWFVLPRECPKLSQRWVCYPINSMNTFENELRMCEENSTRLMLLRMVILKCFCKVVKNDVVPVKFDINNILLVSSSCGLIVVFKESQVDLDVATFDILKSETLEDVPNQFGIIKTDIKEALSKFFYRLTVISVLISSIWPLDFLAYILAKLLMDTDN